MGKQTYWPILQGQLLNGLIKEGVRLIELLKHYVDEKRV